MARFIRQQVQIQIGAMQNQPENERLFGLYDTITLGENRCDLILPTCLVLIGLTRVGKSTLFNWINGKALIGKENDFGVVNYYPVNQNDKNVAEVSDAQISKTLIPNVHNVEEVSRIDPAGFKDKRNHVGVFSVNCMLNFIFQKGRRFSFLLVVCRNDLGETGSRVLDTLYHFINLFDYDNLDTATREQLMSSVSLVITKAGGAAGDDKVLKNLNGILTHCKSQKYRHEKKESCLAVLEHIVRSQRLVFFRNARENENAPECDILQTLLVRGWTPFDLYAAKAQYPQILINSFKKQFADLGQGEQDCYMRVVDSRVRGYSQVANIYDQMKETIISCLAQPEIDYKPIFDQMARYLARFDEYTGVNRDIEVRAKYNGMSLRRSGGEPRGETIKTMVRVRRVVELITTIDKISTDIYDDNQLIAIQKRIYTKIFLAMQELCCRTVEEECTLINFAFVVLRGFDEFRAILQVDFVHWNSSTLRQIYDYLISTTNRTVMAYKLQIVRNISGLQRQVKQATFPKVEELVEFVGFSRDFTVEYRELVEVTVLEELRVRNIDDRLLCCEMMLEEGNRLPEVLNSSVSIFYDLIEERENVHRSLLQRNVRSEDVRVQTEAIRLEDYFLNCIRILGGVLVKKKLFVLAINVFNTIEETPMICECYELQLESHVGRSRGKTVDCQQLQMLCIGFADYCASHGRFDKAVTVLQEYQRWVTSSVKLRAMKEKVGVYLLERVQNEEKYRKECEERGGFFEMDRLGLVNLGEQVRRVEAEVSASTSLNHSVNDSR